MSTSTAASIPPVAGLRGGCSTGFSRPFPPPQGSDTIGIASRPAVHFNQFCPASPAHVSLASPAQGPPDESVFVRREEREEGDDGVRGDNQEHWGLVDRMDRRGNALPGHADGPGAIAGLVMDRVWRLMIERKEHNHAHPCRETAAN